ncbi:hypothetical protein IL54_0952 [Sphingobium sp. ba1]|nr:hypothetical protein IL54_0952 [Sphingobium sp. ba1]
MNERRLLGTENSTLNVDKWRMAESRWETQRLV